MSIIYLDTSALVKRYISEFGSQETRQQIEAAQIVGTAAITRAEMGAAFAKAHRMGLISQDAARTVWEAFLMDWPSLSVVQILPNLVSHAGDLAWTHHLRGYNAVHLAAALTWQDMLGEAIAFVAFDKQLWSAAKHMGLQVWPPNLIKSQF